MADTKVQNESQNQSSVQRQSSGQQRAVSRRQEYYPSRDLFSFSPFSIMRRLTEEMDRAFASSFGLPRAFGEAATWTPAVEVREENGNLDIAAELPGMTKDDVKVECTDQGIIIEGEKKREKTSEEGGYQRTERSYGHFYRMIPLPEGADADKANAEFKDGVLHVRLPINQQQQKARQIPINAK